LLGEKNVENTVKSTLSPAQTATVEVAPKPAVQVAPAVPSNAAQAAVQERVVKLSFEGHHRFSVVAPKELDLNIEWSKFKRDHAFVSDQKGAFPHSFMGDLITKLGCRSVPISTPSTEALDFTI
jgi:hypothetical protein